MAKTDDNAYSHLYERPLVRMRGYEERYKLPGRLYAYLNYGGPTNSCKDALAEGMLSIAMEKGRLEAGQPLVEASAGTFAVALTIAGVRRGHPVHLVMPSNISPERRRYLMFLGATVVESSYLRGRSGVTEHAQQLTEELGAYFVDYLSNDDNAEFHRRVTGPAIHKALGDKMDALVVGVGSSGTLTGAAEYLKAWVGDIWTVAVQPFESQTLTGGFAAPHTLTGLGVGVVPGNYNAYVVDEVMSVTSGDAKTAMRDALSDDAVPASIASGAVLHAARRMCQKGRSRVVCILNGAEWYE